MSRETCTKGHKWLTEVAGFKVCPVCGDPPVPKPNYEEQALRAWDPPAGHSATTIDIGEVTVFVCGRGRV